MMPASGHPPARQERKRKWKWARQMTAACARQHARRERMMAACAGLALRHPFGHAIRLRFPWSRPWWSRLDRSRQRFWAASDSRSDSRRATAATRHPSNRGRSATVSRRADGFRFHRRHHRHRRFRAEVPMKLKTPRHRPRDFREALLSCHRPTSFDIEDALAPLGDTEAGEVPVPAPIFRPLPPAPYPAPDADPPLVLNQPLTVDFSGAVSALLPEKRGGPSGWLAALLILASAVGGAALADRTTRATVTALTTAERSAASAMDRPVAPSASDSPVVHAPPVPAAVEAATRPAAPTPRPNAEGEADEAAPPAPADTVDTKAAAPADNQSANLRAPTRKHHPSHLKRITAASTDRAQNRCPKKLCRVRAC